MLKTSGSPDEPASSKNNSSKSASSRNNNSRPAFWRNNSDDEDDGFGGEKHAKKSGKSKGQKLAKSQKLSKSGKSKGEKSKKPSKIGNSPNFDATETGSSFLTPGAREAFNRLWLAFTKALILCHFDPEYHIGIETNVSGYAIGGVLRQLASGTRPDEVVIKTNLG